MKLFGLILIGFMDFISLTTANSSYCYSRDKNPYLFFGTKTAYYVTQQTKTPMPPMQGCTPAQIWLVARHGTRYPQGKAVERMQGLPKLRDQIMSSKNELCKQDLNLLKNWKVNPNMVATKVGHLTQQGEKEMQLFGNRLRDSFPDLFKDPINAKNYKFQATKTQRTENSMLHFMQGIFKNKITVKPEDIPGSDILLNPYKTCPDWIKSLETNQVNKAAENFKNGPEIKNLLQNLSKRLGISVNLQSKSAQSIKILYDTCRFEKSWEIKRPSAWCAVFTKEDMKLLEYLEDLNYYYKLGPGYEINKNLGCPLLQDIFTHFKNLENADTSKEPKGIFYFTHSSILQNVMIALGIGKDLTPITEINYASMGNRNFRTSKLLSFSANLAAVFYRCTDKRSPYKVLFMVNEQPVNVKGCIGGVCDWKMLQQKFGHLATCDPNFCKGGASTSG